MKIIKYLLKERSANLIMLMILIIFSLLNFILIFRGSPIANVFAQIFPSHHIRFVFLEYVAYGVNLTLILILAVYLNKVNHDIRLQKIITFYLFLVFILAIFGSIALSVLDSAVWVRGEVWNYSLNHFGVYLDYLRVFAIFCGVDTIFLFPQFRYLFNKLSPQIIAILKSIFKKLIIDGQNERMKLNLGAIILILIVLKISLNSLTFFPQFIRNEYHLGRYYASIPSQKRFDMGFYGFKDQIDRINRIVPMNGTIVQPDQSNSQFPQIGNQVFLRYFVFPRNLVSYSKLKNFLKDQNKSNKNEIYMIIYKGGGGQIFPPKQYQTEKTWIFDQNGKMREYDKYIFMPSNFSKLDFSIGLMKNPQYVNSNL